MHLSFGDRKAAEVVVAGLEADYKSKPTLENSNDLAVAKLLMNDREEAITLLREVEQKYPGNAIVAANLGTALELSGIDEEALRWIREGVRRDPDEHFGSEWLHVRILEVKAALKHDADWFGKQTVLGLEFGTGAVPVLSSALPIGRRGKPLTAKQVIESINYQLGERVKFIDPPDPVIADLYATAGELAWSNGIPKSADEYTGDPAAYYEAALNFHASREALVKLRKQAFDAQYPGVKWMAAAFESLAAGGKVESPAAPSVWRWPLVVAVLLAVLGAVALYPRIRKP